MTTQEAAGYISAIIDGEGWVAEQRPERSRRIYRVTISNTEQDIIDGVREALDVLGVRHYINTQNKQPPRVPVHHVIISHREGLTRLHEVVRLRSGRKQAALNEQIRLYGH